MGAFETSLLHLVTNVLTAVGYPGLFVLMAVEGFGIPIPSEVTMPFSGFMTTTAGGKQFSVGWAIVVGSVGEIAGSAAAYVLGLHGGRRMVARYGRIVRLGPAELDRAETWFKRYGDVVVLVARLLPAARGLVALPAGIVRMSPYRFMTYSTVGSVFWCVALVLVGRALGQHWNQVSGDIRGYNWILYVLVGALIVFAAMKRIRRGQLQPQTVDAAPAEEAVL